MKNDGFICSYRLLNEARSRENTCPRLKETLHKKVSFSKCELKIVNKPKKEKYEQKTAVFFTFFKEIFCAKFHLFGNEMAYCPVFTILWMTMKWFLQI